MRTGPTSGLSYIVTSYSTYFDWPFRVSLPNPPSGWSVTEMALGGGAYRYTYTLTAVPVTTATSVALGTDILYTNSQGAAIPGFILEGKPYYSNQSMPSTLTITGKVSYSYYVPSFPDGCSGSTSNPVNYSWDLNIPLYPVGRSMSAATTSDLSGEIGVNSPAN